MTSRGVRGAADKGGRSWSMGQLAIKKYEKIVIKEKFEIVIDKGKSKVVKATIIVNN